MRELNYVLTLLHVNSEICYGFFLSSLYIIIIILSVRSHYLLMLFLQLFRRTYDDTDKEGIFS